MPQYTLSVQGNIYKTITTTDGIDVGTVTNMINTDIANGNVTIDASLPLNISIAPVAGT